MLEPKSRDGNSTVKQVKLVLMAGSKGVNSNRQRLLVKPLERVKGQRSTGKWTTSPSRCWPPT